MPLSTLSKRERQVLQLVALGKTSREIAFALGVSPGTVDTYRRRLMTKLDIDNLPNLVRFAVRHGVVTPWP